MGAAGGACAAAVRRLGEGAGACRLGPVAAWPQTLRTTLDLMLDAAVPMALFWGPQALVFHNDRCLAAVGDAHPQALGRPAAEAGPPWTGWLPLIDGVRACGVARSVHEQPLRIRRADGAWRWHLVRALPIESGEGGASGWVGTNTDIDDQRAVLAELARLNATLEERVEERTRERDRMWRLSTDVMSVVRFDGTIVAVNPAWQALLGWSEAELAAVTA